jgi:hypothetical protein
MAVLAPMPSASDAIAMAAPQTAQGMARVLQNPLQRLKRPHIPTLLSGERDVAHQFARIAAVSRQQNAMGLHLFSQLAIQPPAAPEQHQFAEEYIHHAPTPFRELCE